MPDPLFLATGAASVQRCEACSSTIAEIDAAAACPRCGGLLEIVHARPNANGGPMASKARQERLSRLPAI